MKKYAEINKAIEYMDSISQYVLDELWQFDINFKELKSSILKIEIQIKEGLYQENPLNDETPQEAYFRKFGKIES